MCKSISECSFEEDQIYMILLGILFFAFLLCTCPVETIPRAEDRAEHVRLPPLRLTWNWHRCKTCKTLSKERCMTCRLCKGCDKVVAAGTTCAQCASATFECPRCQRTCVPYVLSCGHVFCKKCAHYMNRCATCKRHIRHRFKLQL
jgi:hypothetical protein